ncbi:MAG: lactonase family protein [Bryobacteraceae bacterium]|jgi:6-phosphogluconolactonase
MTRRSLGQALTLAAVLFGAASSALPQSAAKAGADWLMYVGTYTNNNQQSKGIYAYRFQASGKLTSLGLAAETSSPSFLVVDRSQKFVYAANELTTYEGRPAGSVSAFAIDAATGQLKLLNKVSSKGSGPCHVSFDETGKWLFAANYFGGSLAEFPVHEDGSLGEASAFIQHSGSSVDHERQSGPHAHSAYVARGNRFVLVDDLGLDHVMVYRLDAAKGTLTANDPPFAKLASGSGPRHLAFGKDGKFVYVLSEMAATVTVFSYNARAGSLAQTQTISMVPAGYTGPKSAAEIAVHPNGKFLYASHRGDSTIAIFRIDPGTGALTAAGNVSTQGKTPRNFAIDPTGAFLLAANQDSGSIVVFRIDQATGALTPTGDTLNVGSPVCIVFAKAH